jgi:formyltetrahydrofolate deformylase
MSSHILTLVCPDRPGIVASIAEGLLALGANIVENAQFSDVPTGMFCMRTRFESPIDDAAEITEALRGRAEALHAELRVRREDQRCRTLIMVSKYDHCLVDLLYRWRAGELQLDIPVVVSNHPDLAETVTAAGIGFEHVAVPDRTPAGAEDRAPAGAEDRAAAGAEDRVRQLVAAHDIELVVLARYMQIVSHDLCREMAGRIINIHHSFLPSFKGAKPYHQAWERGVKVIGATAHYVTPDLDEGPIIDQDVARVAHSHTPEQMVIIGRDLERLVLSRAVKAHSEGRIFLLGRRTVVFL